MSIQPGQTILNNKYRIERLLGEGGMARVWLAEELTFGGRRVALKEPRDDLLPDLAQEVRLRYQREVQVCAALDKARVLNIVRAFTADPHEDTVLLAMEYMPGGDLAVMLKKHPDGLPVEQAVAITLDLLEALEGVHAHELEIVHRDVKPSNVLFDEHGKAHLADFGLAQLAGMSGRSQLAGGHHPGTPMYMAPEQARSQDMLLPAADLYAVGCIMFEMLTGKRYKRVRPGTVPSTLCTEVPLWLDEVVAQALTEDPWGRIQHAGEIADALRYRIQEWGELQARKAELVRLYESVQGAVESGKWKAALDLCEQIQRLEPGYRDIEDLRSTAQQGHRAEHEEERQKRLRQAQLASAVNEVGLESGMPKPVTAQGPVQRIPARARRLGVLAIVALAVGAALAFISLPKRYLPPIESVQTQSRSSDGMEMVYVPEGEFEMGKRVDLITSLEIRLGMHHLDFEPAHTVYLYAYWIDRTEVTNDQYRQCVAAGQCRAPTECLSGESTYGDADKGDHPAACVSWDDAVDYCSWAGARLPTEAEWEKAARGTDGRVYPWGDEFDCDKANVTDYIELAGDEYPGGGDCVGYGRTAAVGSYPAGASPYGALDMAGGVEEWVADWYEHDYYVDSPRENPEGPASGEYRVVRGGSWDSWYPSAESFSRTHSRPDHPITVKGFRCAVSP